MFEQMEEVNAIQGQRGGGINYNMNSNTYHPGLRNHPNFSYRNPTNQSNPNFKESLKVTMTLANNIQVLKEIIEEGAIKGIKAISANR